MTNLLVVASSIGSFVWYEVIMTCLDLYLHDYMTLVVSVHIVMTRQSVRMAFGRTSELLAWFS